MESVARISVVFMEMFFQRFRTHTQLASYDANSIVTNRYMMTGAIKCDVVPSPASTSWLFESSASILAQGWLRSILLRMVAPSFEMTCLRRLSAMGTSHQKLNYLEGSFLAVSTPIFACVFHCAACFKIYTICTLLHLCR